MSDPRPPQPAGISRGDARVAEQTSGPLHEDDEITDEPGGRQTVGDPNELPDADALLTTENPRMFGEREIADRRESTVEAAPVDPHDPLGLHSGD